MSFSQESLLHKLSELSDLAGEPARLVVAFSGGLDSTVLLHALAVTRDTHNAALLAVYVDHQLHDESGNWGDHCATFANALNVAFERVRIVVDSNAGLGIEGAARLARYDALRNVVSDSDWLLSAHHKDDQAETLLLNLMRGSGPSGLAGIAEIRPFSTAWLVRPVLSYSRSELQDYATQHDLSWIDDPSNEDRQFDRNYLRHDVLPRLEHRWPGVANRLRNSALLAGEAATMLDQLADADLQTLGKRPDRLSLDALRSLQPERQRNVLRYVVRELGLPSPPATRLRSIVTDLIPARGDAQPVVQWTGAEIRRYRDQVYVLPVRASVEPPATAVSADKIELGAGMGHIDLEAGAAQGLAESVVARGLELRFRQGGEEIRPIGQSHTKKLKKLLQEEGIVPWMRDQLPLLYSGNELVAVADLWIAASAAAEPGTALHWKNRPPIH